MRHLCCSKLLFLLFLGFSCLHAGPQEKSAIVYYGKDISYSNVGIHDYIIVESDNISPYTHGFKSYKEKIYAYVSVGEASAYRDYFKALREEWKISLNRAWNSVVMDISNDDYHAFMYERVIQPLIDKGYENFFFDTLDSYQIAAKREEERREYERGLVRFVRGFKERFPGSKLIVNRGFEVMDEIHESVEAVLFESLFYGLSSVNLAYSRVKKEDRRWLLNHIEKVKSYGLELICVDYIDIKEKEKIGQTLKKIKELGLIPYIANKELTRYGSSSKEAVRREVLILHNSLYSKNYSGAHQMASLPLEYLGYIPIIKRIDQGLPDKDELTRFKAIIVWPEQPIKEEAMAFREWVSSVMDEEVKLLFLDGFGVSDDSFLSSLKIKTEKNRSDAPERQSIAFKDPVFGFEDHGIPPYNDTVYMPSSADALLLVSNRHDQASVLAAKTQWGGYTLSDTAILSQGTTSLWRINPFEFFKMVLELEDIPVPDPTTENGRRLLFSHIDGDGSMNRAEWDAKKYSIEVIYEEILKKYTIPQSMSIVQAEMHKEGPYPKDAAALEKEAKKIFQLGHVEAATHTLTHPFQWGKIVDGNLSEAYRLKLKGYDFSIDREIRGSLDYINTRLLPPLKAKANTIYWTGDCLPGKEVLEYVYKHNILNINGGDTVITNDRPWLSLVAPYGLKRGEYYQVYTGAQNENVYTNNFKGPFWGYKKVIQTFKLTEKPRRLKPIDIYYHLYAGSKRASLSALNEVYEWALKQETMPIYTSEYIPKVMEFYDLSMMQERDGWHIQGMKELKTLRLNKAMPSFGYSETVLGEKAEEDVRYLHLNTEAQKLKLFVDEFGQKDKSYLVDTNARLLGYKKEKEISFGLQAYVDISLNYHLKEGCEIITRPEAFKKVKKGALVSLEFKVKEADVIIRCQ